MNELEHEGLKTCWVRAQRISLPIIGHIAFSSGIQVAAGSPLALRIS